MLVEVKGYTYRRMLTAATPNCSRSFASAQIVSEILWLIGIEMDVKVLGAGLLSSSGN